MNSGKFNMFRNGIGYQFPIFCHSINFNLFGLFNKFGNHDRMFFRNVRGQGQEMLQLVFVRNHVHSSARKHVRRTDQNRETNYIDKSINIFNRRQFRPARLINLQSIAQRTELFAVFGPVDIQGRSAQNRHILSVQFHRQVVRNLATHREYQSFRSFQINNIHHPFEG